MARDLVLLTGASGFIGFATLQAALSHGYQVRAAVRSGQKADLVRSSSTMRDVRGDQLEFVIVPDFLVEGAFDEAVKGVKFIVHVASPLPDPKWSVENDDLDALMVQPAVQGTLGLFRSAQKVKCVQRVVVTSSVASLAPFANIAGEPTEQRFGPQDRCDPIPSPFMNIPQVAYHTSKILALKRAEDFVQSEKPSFDVIHIHPTIVLGRDELATTPEAVDSGSNAWALGPALGRRSEKPVPAIVTHVDDVALAHVRALNPDVPGNQSFLLNNSEGDNWTVCVHPSIKALMTLAMRLLTCMSLLAERYQAIRAEALPRRRGGGLGSERWRDCKWSDRDGL